MAIGWSAEFSVGWGDLDEQHREIIHALAVVEERIGASDSVGTGAALGGLVDRVVRHFAAEEGLMDRWRYPERAAHKRAHDLFLHDLMALVQEHREDGLTQDVAEWAQARVPDWFTFHIQANDTPLGRYLALRVSGSRERPADEKPPRT